MTSTSSPQIVDLSEENSSMRQSMEFNSTSTPIGVDLGPDEEANLTSAAQDAFQLPFEKKKWEHVFQSKATPEAARQQSKPPQLDLELDEHMAKPVGVSLAPDKVHGVLGGTSSTFTDKNARALATDKGARKNSRKASSEKNNATKDVAFKEPDLALKKPKRKSKELMKAAGSINTKAKQTQDASRPSDENCNDYIPVKKRAVSYAGQQLSNVIDISDDQDEVEDVIQILEEEKAAANRKVIIIDLTEDETDCMAPARKRSVTALHCSGESAKQDPISTSRRDTDRKASKRQEPERRYVFHSAPKKSHKNEWQKHNFNATLSNEDAAREQERLFRESAARVKSQARFQVIRTQHDPRKIAFPQPLANVHQKFPEHWTFFNTYSRLGLHQEAPLHLVKLHYRTLARIYHPDKSGTDDTSRKFQAITEAYTTIVMQGS